MSDKLTEKFGDNLVSADMRYDFPVFELKKVVIFEALKFLKEDAELNFHFLTTLCGLHFPDNRGKELGMMYQLHNMPKNWRIRIYTFMPEKEVDVPSVTSLWPAANWLERETYDFFGFKFIGHPDLRRILNMDQMNYHPMLNMSELIKPKPTIKAPDNKEYNILNLGPTHPATHGIFQNVLKLDGEVIVDAQPTIGYIHRAFEKLAERRPYNQITPITDRLNYCSSPINNMGWHMTVEKLIGAEIPKRAEYMRVIIMELSRIADHIVCDTVIAVDTGAMTGFLYLFQSREHIYEIFENICGARLTTNIGRIGGMEKEFSPHTWELLNNFMKNFPDQLREFEKMVVRNRIFMDRTINVGGITAEKALGYGFTGPNLRAAGVDYDVRVANPYCSYGDFEFDIPIGTQGDTYDRFMVRLEEMWQSYRIIEQAIKNMPDGKVHADLPEFYLPPKQDVYSKMEALIYHFKIVMGETHVPKGEVYHSVEGGNGELGFYLVSDGGRTPYRLQFRRPCFIYYQAYPEMIKGAMLSDAILTMSSMNVIAEEIKFSDSAMAEIQEIVSRYPAGKQKSALLPALHIAQREFGGWLSAPVMDYVASILNIKPIEVYEVASFYTMFNLKQRGKCLIEVCQTSSCWMMGAEDIVRHLEKRLGIKNGETTPDGMFTIKTVECLGACGYAPMFQ
ncbi:unnamed protein product, partial [Darwinula stevensoni]